MGAPPWTARSISSDSSPALVRQSRSYNDNDGECGLAPGGRTPGSLRFVHDRPGPPIPGFLPHAGDPPSTVESATLAAVATTVWMILVLLSTPTWAFIPKYH